MTRSRIALATLATFIALLSLEPTLAAPQTLTGKVTDVTLYRGQAMVTRTISVDGPKGGLEVIVTDLPDKIVAGSMFAEGGESLETRGLEATSRQQVYDGFLMSFEYGQEITEP